MPFKQVTEQDLKGKGVIGQPAVPGLSVTEMQKSVEQVVREAAIPAHNQLCEQLEAEEAAADIGAAVPGSGDMPTETPKKLQSVLEAMLAWAKKKLGLKADKADTYTKQETEEKISEGISETGFEEAVQEAKQSAQEAKEYAESINPAQFAQAEEGVTTVNASKTQNTFDIELPNSNQFVIIPDAAYASGDTFKIAAQPVAAKLPNGDSLPDGFFEAGAKVLCLLKDNVLYFTGGGNAPGDVMRYRLDDGTPGQQPEQTIWGQTSDGQDAYVHSCTKAVYNPETGKTLDEEMVTMQDSPAAITGETPIKPVCDASGNVICPQTRTESVYDPESGQTMDKVIHPVYSTTEQWTGDYWIDGKPVFLKVIQFVSPSASTGNVATSIGVAIDKFIDTKIVLELDEGYFCQFSQNAVQDNDRIYAQFANDNGVGGQKNSVLLNTNASRYANKNVVAIIKYTKMD